MRKNVKTISAFLFGAVLIGSLIIVSCKKDDDGDGKINPSTIATANLIYYWNFENTPTDQIASKGTATGNITYPVGRRGLGFQGALNSYISWDIALTDKIATLHGYTIATWMKAPKVTVGPPMIFQITGPEFLGALAFLQENAPENNTVDSLELKAFFTKASALDKDGNLGWVGHDWRKSKTEFAADFWFHIAFNYDPATSKAKIYVNGDLLFISTGAYSDEVRYQGDPGGIGNPNGQPLLGNLDLKLNASGNKGIIGGWANKRFGTATDDWMGDYLGMLDELRVYDKALTDAEVAALYEAEVTQINE